jgi:cyanate lyase
MPPTKTLDQWMTDKGVSVAGLAEAAALDKRVVEAIRLCRYTTSPEQRQALSAALGLSSDQIQWGHGGHVEHIYGHGPQFGRSP